MSASPTNTSTKRPLEDASSPSRTNDQPEAKRPALEGIIKNNGCDEENAHVPEANGTAIPSAGGTNRVASKKNGGGKTDTKDSSGDVGLRDSAVVKPAPPSSVGQAGSSALAPNTNDETAWIHIRAVISSPEAATIIGKGGENVSNIRKMSHAKCTVSDYQKGAVERILTVSGVVDAVAKAFGLIIRTLNNEPLNEASNQQSKTYPLRLLIPHVLIGSIIGKGGSRIREIQEASGARLNASDACLPLSSERSLVVMGVADAVHIATYYVGSTLLEQLNERFGGPAASAYATRSGGPVGVPPGGLQVVPYSPQPSQGHYGHRDNYNRRQDPRSHCASQGGGYGPQGGSYVSHGHTPQTNPNMPMHYQPQGGYGAGSQMQQSHHLSHSGQQPHLGGHPGQSMTGQPLTQQIYIPNDMVGAIIGKGGLKINEIRQMSGSVIKINEPQDNSNERLVTITGSEECNRMALYMLYSRLENEKHRI